MHSIFLELEKIVSVQQLHADGVSAVSLAVLLNGQLLSKVLTDESETSLTLYQACSISKAMTALAVARLVDQGRLRYDTKIIELVPVDLLVPLAGPNSQHLLEHITVSHILSHTSGMSQGGFPGYPYSSPPLATVLTGEFPSRTIGLRLATPPGTQYCYSGGAFCILQIALEHLIAKPFPALMHELVFQPLGMSRSYFGSLRAGENFSPAYLTAQTPCDVTHHVFSEQAAAGLWTTPSDLLTAIQSVQQSLRASHGGFLTKDTAGEMLRVVVDLGPAGQIANGWRRADDYFGHSGANDPGYRCNVLGSFRGTDRGLAIMTASACGTAVVCKVMQAIAYLMVWAPMDLLGGKDFVPYPAKAGTQPDPRWKEWTGLWDSTWKLFSDQEMAKIAFGELPALTMVPAATPVEKGDIAFVVQDMSLSVTMIELDGKKSIRLLYAANNSDSRGSTSILESWQALEQPPSY